MQFIRIIIFPSLILWVNIDKDLDRQHLKSPDQVNYIHHWIQLKGQILILHLLFNPLRTIAAYMRHRNT